MTSQRQRQQAPASQRNSSGIVLTGRDSYPPTTRSYYGTGGNRLIPAAQPNLDRKTTYLLDFDVHRNVTNYGRRIMMTLGRSLYCAYDVVRGAVDEMARTAAKSFVPEYRGSNQTFEEQIHAWLYTHDQVADIAGFPYDMHSYRDLLVHSIFTDGDMGTLFVRDDSGQPRLQIIPGHRIGSADGEPFVTGGGPYDGARIISGVILGDYSNPIAYRVLLGDSHDTENFVDIPADRMTLSFIPQFPGQVRGFSQIGYSAWNWQDLAEADRWELLAQKAGAGRVFQEWNQEGEPTPGADYITAPAAGATTAGTPTGLWYETIEGGINTYFKSSDPNAQIKAVTFDRPSSNQQNFHKSKVREALYAAGWSDMYSLNPEAGGAFLRVLVEKLNDTIDHLGDRIIEKTLRRFDAFRIATAIENKDLPLVPDFLDLEYIRAPRKTADRKYEIEVDEQELRLGITTRRKKIGARGECEEDVREENEKSIDDLLERAQRIAAKRGVDVSLVLSLFELVTPNGNLPAGQASASSSESA